MENRSPAVSLDRPAPAETSTSMRVPFFAGVVLVALAGAIVLLSLDYRVAITLGMVQGLSEFLPISSSAHLILTPWFLGWPDPGLTFDIALHVGTLVAVAVYFWHDWLALLRAAPHPDMPQGRLFWLLVLGAIPGGVVGVLLDNLAEHALRSPLLIAGTLALMALALFAADRWGARNRGLLDIGPLDALLIGTAQAIAIVPGVSRSGITMTLARMRGLDRDSAARFSFLLGSPVIAGAALFKLRHLSELAGSIGIPFLAGVVTSAVVGALSIGFLLRYLRQFGFSIFVVYRLLLAALVVATLLLGLR